MRLFGTMKINHKHHLEIGGCDTVELAKEFGTPLYVVDEELVRDNCRTFAKHFSSNEIETEVIYASKAFLNIAMCKLIQQEGLSLDVVSGGEIYTALRAEFPAERIYFHGNNKTVAELSLAIASGIGRIVVDNFGELEKIEAICDDQNKKIKVLIRVNPGIDAHTHEYIQTSKNDSKFGVSIFSDEVIHMVQALKNSRNIQLQGFHCHIGSQIFQEESFYSGIKVMMEFVKKIEEDSNLVTEELNLGGGFGVYYTGDDNPVDLSMCLPNMLSMIKSEAARLNMKLPKVMIEPGRAIVANAGTTLYEVGGIKKTYGGRNYIFVDGGMADNPRTALYDAKYDAIIANKANESAGEVYTIAGKCCESGDVLIKDIHLPETEKGDIAAVLTTGAYNYSMSSNYNRIARPAVVFVSQGSARLAVRRETMEDLVRNDIF